MPEVVRERPRILPVVGQLVAGRMPQHVWMRFRRRTLRGRCAGLSARTKPLSLAFRPRSRTRRGYVVRDAHVQALAYVYSRTTETDVLQARVLTDDEARRVAINLARLPDLLGHRE